VPLQKTLALIASICIDVIIEFTFKSLQSSCTSSTRRIEWLERPFPNDLLPAIASSKGTRHSIKLVASCFLFFRVFLPIIASKYQSYKKRPVSRGYRRMLTSECDAQEMKEVLHYGECASYTSQVISTTKNPLPSYLSLLPSSSGATARQYGDPR
jgi:hypothetical protein